MLPRCSVRDARRTWMHSRVCMLSPISESREYNARLYRAIGLDIARNLREFSGEISFTGYITGETLARSYVFRRAAANRSPMCDM